MEIHLILGYLGAVLIGLVLGLIGGGGSILTLPVLVYLFGIEPVIATAYSLFIVGVAAVAGTLKNMSQKLVDFKTALIFALPAFIAVYLTRRYLVPALPDPLFTLGDWSLSKDVGIMVFFALIMVLASVSMIRDRRSESDAKPEAEPQYNYPLIVLEGFVVGVLTGIVGAGGGFLIIPALVLLAKLPMKKAVATSLLIIAIKSLIGFIGDVQVIQIDWKFLMIFAALSVVGIFAGVRLNQIVPGKKLKKGFGWFVLVMGVFIVLRELL
jgi:uncharacterized membrane protein YfcA